MNAVRTSLAALAIPALLVSTNASAQEAPAPLPPPAVPAAPPPQSTTAPAPPSTLVSAPQERATFTAETPDQDRFVGRFAVGFMGIANLPVGSLSTGTLPTGGTNTDKASLSAPIIGVRYWFNRDLGLDLGVGIGYASGSRDQTSNTGTTVSADQPSTYAMAVHGGVPIAFAHGRHFSFLVIPEITAGFSTGSAGGNTVSGFLLNLGGRIGGEIHFGFIGVPELSLQATVGAGIERDSWKVSNNGASNGGTDFFFGTSVQAAPWAIFTNNISAFYYF